MTRAEAVLALETLVRGLPPGTVADRATRLAERLANHEAVAELRDALVELALQQIAEADRGGR